MRRIAPLLAAVLAASAGLAADPVASPAGLDGFVRTDRLPMPPDPFLAVGRTVWGATCENCHGGNKLTGAPKITSTADWAPRIAQGMDLLVAHATDGFMGPRFTEMPARGGNAALGDAEVAAAVAFMVWASGGAEAALDFARPFQTKENEHE
ncbi:cytochrome c5 family protein [Meridianimarinicoccus roseus]|uniref:Cytochrome c5 family protein n=1 Tax=Meridianimarinicoccus roseus TaxID=2072018 RepID=A0A2V2LBU0_9RHOB|nr:c-type cytochrome [Meridianimarinicoccus roseus]PWR01201.1 cytochrome c5 family protein [Meridianimarinicoccus roseus]